MRNWCKVEQSDFRQNNGMANSEMEMCMWKNGCEMSFVKAASFGDGKHTTLRVRSLGSAFCRST